MGTPYFELRNVSKYFANVIANKDISMTIERGETLALLGENGAGKSTIMKILYGLYHADEGEIFKDGVEEKINSPKDAMKLGIGMIQQHFSLVPANSVLENIILGNTHGRIDYKAKEAEVQSLCDEHGFDIPVLEKVGALDVGTQQKVEIVKALYLNANLLIMDEPTAVLTPQESDKLMDFVKNFTAQGNAVVFITHKLKEVMQVADRIIVMRDGMICGNLKTSETNEGELSRLMIGRDLAELPDVPIVENDRNDVCLEAKDVTLQINKEVPLLDSISFSIRHGEILGVAGVSGNGQEELCEVICGSKKPTSGKILLNGHDISHENVRQHIQSGIGYVPVDRYRDAMIMDMSLAENMMLKSSYSKEWQKGIFINNKKLNQHTSDVIVEYDVKAPGAEARAGSLSGGNQQKIVLAREVEHAKELLVLNQPTRGLDLGAINNIHNEILRQREAGKAVLLISTELSEIFALSARIAVMYKGRFVGIYNKSELTTEKIGLLMAGYSEDMKEASV